MKGGLAPLSGHTSIESCVEGNDISITTVKPQDPQSLPVDKDGTIPCIG